MSSFMTAKRAGAEGGQKEFEDEEVIVSLSMERPSDGDLLELYAIYRGMGGEPLARYEAMLSEQERASNATKV